MTIDSTHTKQTFQETIAEVLDDYAQQYSQLLRTPTIEAKDIKDRKNAEEEASQSDPHNLSQGSSRDE